MLYVSWANNSVVKLFCVQNIEIQYTTKIAISEHFFRLEFIGWLLQIACISNCLACSTFFLICCCCCYSNKAFVSQLFIWLMYEHLSLMWKLHIRTLDDDRRPIDVNCIHTHRHNSSLNSHKYHQQIALYLVHSLFVSFGKNLKHAPLLASALDHRVLFLSVSFGLFLFPPTGYNQIKYIERLGLDLLCCYVMMSDAQ